MASDTQMTPSGRGRAIARRMDAEQRAMRAWSMRVRGLSWQEVASELGYSDKSNAIRAVKSFFGGLPTAGEDREELRAVWRSRHEVLWKIALEDARKRKPGAVRAAAAVSLASRQLDGLDAPQRIQVDTSMAELDQIVRTLIAATEPELELEADVWDADNLPPEREDAAGDRAQMTPDGVVRELER